jgi:hypothetical protein
VRDRTCDGVGVTRVGGKVDQIALADDFGEHRVAGIGTARVGRDQPIDRMALGQQRLERL